MSNAENSPATSEAAVSIAQLLAKLAQAEETSRARGGGRAPALESELAPTERLNALRQKIRAVEAKRKETSTERLARLLNAPSEVYDPRSSHAPEEAAPRKRARKQAATEKPARGRHKK
ncbi:hypothetical protein [Polyangium sorediatum]|uniref:Uncharacterized protein n=1 Tax=Polyangium sorediatum TaxID=889274 RepID=A0ABT6NY18_9BACT|nr:hypothetical protein [Polyangium sorediatum]MDI1433255.1 hypothetical protein [Polyangium sorediatum]